MCKKRLFSNNKTPVVPGGGTVLFVSRTTHTYLDNIEEREEGGTPDILGSIRLGLVFQMKQRLGCVEVRGVEVRDVEVRDVEVRGTSIMRRRRDARLLIRAEQGRGPIRTR